MKLTISIFFWSSSSSDERDIELEDSKSACLAVAKKKGGENIHIILKSKFDLNQNEINKVVTKKLQMLNHSLLMKPFLFHRNI